MKKVLIVEDDKFILKVISDFLASSGYETRQCTNGQEGLDALEKESFDAIVTDIMMPKVDGIEFLNEIRRNNIQIPVLAMSSDEETGHKADEKTDFGYYFDYSVLKKPVQKEELLEILENLIGKPNKA